MNSFVEKNLNIKTWTHSLIGSLEQLMGGNKYFCCSVWMAIFVILPSTIRLTSYKTMCTGLKSVTYLRYRLFSTSYKFFVLKFARSNNFQIHFQLANIPCICTMCGSHIVSESKIVVEKYIVGIKCNLDLLYSELYISRICRFYLSM